MIKLQIIAFWILAVIICQGQEAANIIKYETVNGKKYGIDVHGNYHQISNFGKAYYGKDPIPKKVSPSEPKEHLQDAGITENEIANDSITLHLPVLRSKNHLKIGGDLFITGSVLFLVGTALIIPGIQRGNSRLIYSGLAVVDIGILFYLGAGISIRKSKVNPQKL